MGRMATVDEFGRAGHLFVEPSGILLHGRRPDCRRRLPLLVGEGRAREGGVGIKKLGLQPTQCRTLK
jgi:hypothetical protein